MGGEAERVSEESSCGNCLFFNVEYGSEKRHPDSFGVCRRYPPTVSDHALITKARSSLYFDDDPEKETYEENSAILNEMFKFMQDSPSLSCFPSVCSHDWCGEYTSDV